MRMVTDIVDPQELLDYLRAWEIEVNRPQSKILLDGLLPNKNIEDIEYKIRKGQLDDVDIAEYRAWDTPPKLSDRAGVSYMRGEIGPISRSIAVTEEESIRTRAMFTHNNDPLIDAIYADARNMVRSVQARIEMARGDVIDDGKVTINENGLVLEADFGRSASMSQTVNNFWTNPTTGTPISDFLGYEQDYLDVNGTTPGFWLMGRRRLTDFTLSGEFLEFASIGGTTPDRINLDTVNAVLAANGIAPIRLYDTGFKIDKVRHRVLPENKVYAFPPDDEPLGNTLFGTTAEALRLAEGGHIDLNDAPGVVACTYINDLPVQTLTAAHAIALPVLGNPDLIMDVVVAA